MKNYGHHNKKYIENVNKGLVWTILSH